MQPIWLVIFGMGALVLPVGFALQASGSVRAKNAATAVLRTAANTAAAGIAFWAIGAAILFQNHNAWFGIDRHFLAAVAPEIAATDFFHMTICIVGGSIVTGALAERSRFYVGLTVSAVLGGLMFPITGHWVWFGKLKDWSFIDYGGGTVVHLSAAVFAAVGVAAIGSRKGKYVASESESISGHSIPMLGTGVLLIFVGWFPYLLGCVLAHWTALSMLDDVAMGIAAINVLLAAMGGMAGALFYSHLRYRNPDLFFIYSGLLGGLVAISPGVMAVSSGGALVIGLLAGILVPMAAMALDTRARLDDPIGLIAIHGVGAIWGTLATAMFVSTFEFTDHFRLLATQSRGLAVVLGLAVITATILFLILRSVGPLRVSDLDEAEGLDLAEHGLNSYPEFNSRG